MFSLPKDIILLLTVLHTHQEYTWSCSVLSENKEKPQPLNFSEHPYSYSMSRTITQAAAHTMCNVENLPGDQPQNNEDFIQGDQPRSEDTQHQRTTGGASRDLRQGADQRDQDINVQQAPTEAPPVMVRSPQATGTYIRGDRIPGSFIVGTVPIEDSPLTSRNTSRVMSTMTNNPTEEDMASTIGQAVQEAVGALELRNTSEVPLSREQVLQNMQEFLHNIENQWWEYEDNTLFDNHGMRPGDHHTRQFRRLHQLIEEFGGGSESPKDED